MSVVALGTYLAPWGTPEIRTVGLDEDALTIAVDAGRAALAGGDVDVHRVVLVTRDLPLLEGGNGAALVAGLGLPAGTEVVEQVGGAPAALDALLAAESGTLVIGADAGTGVGAGAAAAVVRDGDGATLAPVARAQRSLPMRTRDREGRVHEYDDARLLRERGTRVRARRIRHHRQGRRRGRPRRTRTRLRSAKAAHRACPRPGRARRSSRSPT